MVARIMIVTVFLLSACEDAPIPMDPVALLSRASIDLRGVRPSLEEIELVEKNPALVDDLIEDFLFAPEFGEQVMHLFAEIYRTRVDRFNTRADRYNLSDERAFYTSVGEAPLRMLAFIAENDIPYGEIASADWTMSDELLGTAWPVDYPEGETGWRQVRYTDGRPKAGILSSNSFWWRYGTTFDNSNRGRANAISRILLCQDYLSQPIEFERNIDLLDREATQNAILNDPGCVACHNSLEPLAASLWGFYYERASSPLDSSFYHPEREIFWSFTNRVPPAYFGEPVIDLSDVGRKISQDPRLAQCVTKQVFEGLLRRKVQSEDTGSLLEHREVFVDSGSLLRPLFRSVLRSPSYRMAGTINPLFTTAKMISVDQFSSLLFDLTGFRFTQNGTDLLRVSETGLRTLAGGADGLVVTSSAHEPTVTMSLVIERFSEAASLFVVTNDAENPNNARLFTEIDFTETPDTDNLAIVSQLQKLRLRLFSKRFSETSPEIVADLELWKAIFAIEKDTKMAWAGILTALFRSPEFLFY